MQKKITRNATRADAGPARERGGEWRAPHTAALRTFLTCAACWGQGPLSPCCYSAALPRAAGVPAEQHFAPETQTGSCQKTLHTYHKEVNHENIKPPQNHPKVTGKPAEQSRINLRGVYAHTHTQTHNHTHNTNHMISENAATPRKTC